MKTKERTEKRYKCRSTGRKIERVLQTNGLQYYRTSELQRR